MLGAEILKHLDKLLLEICSSIQRNSSFPRRRSFFGDDHRRNPISGEFLASPTTWRPSTCFYGFVGAYFAVVHAVGGDLAVAQVEPLATARRRTALMIFFIRRHSKWIPSSYASSRWRPSSKRRSETSFRWGAAARSTLDLMEPVYGNIGSVQGFLVWK
jgi:hypothetical protein